MKDLFAQLSPEEQQLMIEVPALMGLYASNHDGRISGDEKKALIKLAHTETFAADRELHPFFKRVEPDFEKILDKYDAKLPAGIVERRDSIKKSLQPVAFLLKKMKEDDRKVWIYNLVKFSKAVAKVHGNISEELLLPMFSDYLHDSFKVSYRKLLNEI